MKSTKIQKVEAPIKQVFLGKKSINGTLYGSGELGVVFSNMDTNDQNEWNPIVTDLISDKHTAFTYDYPKHMDDQSGTLEDAISFIREQGAKKIILIGASRGGVASIKVAARHVTDDNIVGVVALSAPIEYEGTVFYSKAELNGILIPKLLINSENDAGANDNRAMFDIFSEPKELLIFPGDAHGTELFNEKRESIVVKLQEFMEYATTIKD